MQDNNLFVIIATFFWLSYVPIAFISLYRVVTNRKIFVKKHAKRVQKDAAIIFQITTRSATTTDVVRRGILSIVTSAHKANFDNYSISVVTDDREDILTLRDLKCEVVVVDRDFRTNAIRKGRALQYAV